MGTSLVVVESPAKARTINKFLGTKFEVVSSVGHVKDLPKKGLGVEVDNGFEPTYVVIEGKEEFLKSLKSKARKADAVYLAPDPDREGEAIAWHIAEEVKGKTPVRRVTFNEITKGAVRAAFEHPRDINLNLVNAQQTRRILDRLVGYQISPLLWKAVKGGLSAGRVQSVTLRLICERERAIEAFKREEYWSVTAHLRGKKPPAFEAVLRKLDGKEAKLSKEPEAAKVVAELKGEKFTVSKVEKKEKVRRPVPPFITSTLQQEAFRHLHFSSSTRASPSARWGTSASSRTCAPTRRASPPRRSGRSARSSPPSMGPSTCPTTRTSTPRARAPRKRTKRSARRCSS